MPLAAIIVQLEGAPGPPQVITIEDHPYIGGKSADAEAGTSSTNVSIGSERFF